jgi:hypothetical protein
MTHKRTPVLTPKFKAGVEMIERTGAQSFRIGYSDEDEGEPVVWYATATWGLDPSTHRPMPAGGRITHEAAAAIHPEEAVLRLCEQVIDGGECSHCHLPTIFVEDSDTSLLDRIGCVYAWDPELETFRRNCEGDT